MPSSNVANVLLRSLKCTLVCCLHFLVIDLIHFQVCGIFALFWRILGAGAVFLLPGRLEGESIRDNMRDRLISRIQQSSSSVYFDSRLSGKCDLH